MTDEERKELEATANWVMIPNEEVSNAATNGLRWGVAPTVARLINNKNEGEIYNLLDYWYKFNNRLSREQFVENVIHLIQHEKHRVTSQQLEWISRWVNPDSLIVRNALKSPTLRTIFGNDLEKLRRYVEYCEVAKTPSQMARAAVNIYDIPEEWRYSKLHDALENIGLPVGNNNNWKTAILKAANQG